MDEIEIALLVLKRAGFGDRVFKDKAFTIVDEVKLMSIYRDLNSIDFNYALEFTKLVENSNTLGVFEFVSNFLAFASNKFLYDNLVLACDLNNKDLDEFGNNKYKLTEIVKENFIFSVSPVNRIIKQYVPVKDNF